MNISREDRVCFFGQTGSGKSELARAMWAGMQPPRIVLDIKDDLASKLPGIPTIHNPAEVLDHLTVRAVPLDPADENWYEQVYEAALKQGDTLVWLDEANELSRPNYVPPKTRKFHLQGRSRSCGHFICTPRPADISPTFAAQSGHIFVFWLTHPRDIMAISEITGRKPATIETLLRERIVSKDTYRFLHFETATGELAVCEPAHDPDRVTAALAARYFGKSTG